MKLPSSIVLILATALLILLLVIFGPVRIVVSDSMEPAIRAGDAILLLPLQKPISPGMVISYDFQGKLITHRVVEVNGTVLRTKGDNNQEMDPWEVPLSSVAGAPALVVPYFGFVLDFIRRPIGWVLCVLLPAAWILWDELKKLRNNLREIRKT